ncbi:MAG: transposase, partial [Thermoplasmata archaeon]|nr:transposase [Candidatus Sysuiplasma jiujiangense]
SLVSSDIPQRVPLLSIPVHMGYNIARDVSFCLEFVRPHFKSVRLCLFDRGFYSNELMIALDRMTVPYLIFVPKNDAVKKVLAPMRSGDTMTVEHEFRLNRDRTVIKGETTYALLRQIYEKRLDRCIDWAFATNQQEIDLDDIVATYRQRWNIENAFKMQDEATIRSKSKDVTIRFFYFAYEQLLQLIWSVFYREEVSFKGMLIALSDTCTERVERAEERAAGKRSVAKGI